MKKKIEWFSDELLISKLKIHPSVQREFNMAHGQDIAKNWQSLVARPLIVVQMTSGDHGFYIVDGQHTKWAAEKVGVKFLYCRIIRAKTKAEMNEIFHLVNSGVRHISPIDSYGMNSRNDSRTADAISNQILEECNLSVGKGTRSPHRIAAVQPVRKAFASLGVEKFAMAASLWEIIANSGNRIGAEVITAVATLVQENGDDETYIQELASLFDQRFGQIHSDANMQCIGSTLSANPHVLVREIEDALSGRGHVSRRAA